VVKGSSADLAHWLIAEGLDDSGDAPTVGLMGPKNDPERTYDAQRANRFEETVTTIASGLDNGSARSFRSYARRYLELVETSNLDPLCPERASLRAALEAAGIHGQAEWKLRWVARKVARHLRDEAEPPAGLGLGRTDHLLAGVEPGVLADAIKAVVASYARPAVARSAIGRLLAWGGDRGVALVELSAGDIPDLELWLRSRVGRPQPEILVVARRLCRALDQLAGH
jgi:hypothetical protein